MKLRRVLSSHAETPIFIEDIRRNCHHQIDDKIKANLTNSGELGFFVGYPDKHPIDEFHIFKIRKKQVIISRNLKWISKMYGDFFNIPKEERSVVIGDIDDEKEDEKEEKSGEEEQKNCECIGYKCNCYVVETSHITDNMDNDIINN